jgi:hypothetical protein
LGRLSTDHNTIANFRKRQSKPFSGFRTTVKQPLELIGGSLVAGTVLKLKAQNSKKIISTSTKLNVTSHIDARLEEYNAFSQTEHLKKIKENTYSKQKIHYIFLPGVTQISTSILMKA